MIGGKNGGEIVNKKGIKYYNMSGEIKMNKKI